MADDGRIHPLRQRMIDDMTLRGMSEVTQRNYLRCVRSFCAFAHKPPEALTFEDARLLQIHLTKSGVSVSTLNGYAVALRFFFRVVLRQSGARDLISLVPPPQRIPTVLTLDETARLLEHAPGLKWRTALSVAYGAGLRAAEVCNLKVSDIDSAQMLIRVVRWTPFVGQVCGVAKLVARVGFQAASRWSAFLGSLSSPAGTRRCERKASLG